MGSYGVIKEALLVKKNDSSDEYSVVQKLLPSTVNGMVSYSGNGGFEFNGKASYVNSVYHGGAFGFSEESGGKIGVTVNIPGYGVKMFGGESLVQNVNGVGKGVLCTPMVSDSTAPYTHLCLVVESPGIVFAKKLG